jgi:hypothetical protein
MLSLLKKLAKDPRYQKRIERNIIKRYNRFNGLCNKLRNNINHFIIEVEKKKRSADTARETDKSNQYSSELIKAKEMLDQLKGIQIKGMSIKESELKESVLVLKYKDRLENVLSNIQRMLDNIERADKYIVEASKDKFIKYEKNIREEIESLMEYFKKSVANMNEAKETIEQMDIRIKQNAGASREGVLDEIIKLKKEVDLLIK